MQLGQYKQSLAHGRRELYAGTAVMLMVGSAIVSGSLEESKESTVRYTAQPRRSFLIVITFQLRVISNLFKRVDRGEKRR